MTTPLHSPAEPEPLQRALLKIRDNKREAEQKNVMQHKISHRIYAFLCAVPSPPCPIPFLTWPWALWPTGDLLELKCGSWAMAWKPAGPPPPIDYLLGNTQGSPTHVSPPAGQVKLLPHTRSEEAPAHTGKAWPGEADRPSLTLRGFQAAPCQGPQVIILAITTPSC